MNRKADKATIPESTMTLGEHLEELRARLILALGGILICAIGCMFFGGKIITFLEAPYIRVMGTEARLQALAPADGFIAYMKIAMIAGLIISSPWVFYQIWMFISAGLYPHERRYVYLATPFCAGLFIAGAMFFILLIAPAMLGFLVMFNKQVLNVSSYFDFARYISFVTLMMLIFGIAFQTPIAVYFLNRTGLVPLNTFKQARKYVILGIVIVAAAATPGSDLVSLSSLSIAMYVLYELGILLCWIAERRAKSRNKVNLS
jgi:sec-independent protein translocase protein TatC